MSNYKWVKRSAEWIKDNPGKPTMYKEFADGVTIEKDAIVTELDKAAIDLREILSVNPDAGIYVIVCEPEKYVYVGQSININNRLRSHKMYLNGKNNTSLINIHFLKHGKEGFKFMSYIAMPDSKVQERLKKEGETMVEFLEDGYSLYNDSLPKEVWFNSVFCPAKYRDVINKFISKLCSEKEDPEKLIKFIDGYDNFNLKF